MKTSSNYPCKKIITYPDEMILNITQFKAIFTIQIVAKANNTFKSPSPEGSQTIQLLCPQLERPPGTISHQGLRKQYEASLNLVPPFPLSQHWLLPSSPCRADKQRQRVRREGSRAEENWSDKASRPTA